MYGGGFCHDDICSGRYCPLVHSQIKALSGEDICVECMLNSYRQLLGTISVEENAG